MTMSRTVQFALATFTVVRIIIVFGFIPTSLNRLLKSPSFTSALVNPVHTFKHLREGNLLIQLSGGSFENAHNTYAFQSPPLLMAVFQPLLSVQPQAIQDILIGVLITLVDLGAALSLFQISRRCLNNYGIGEDDESWAQREMHERIRPARAWVFGIKYGSKDTIEEKEKDPFEREEKSKPSSQAPVKSLFDISVLPQVCCLLYYCNPVTVLASVGTNDQSFQSIFYLLFLLALREVSRGADAHKTSRGQAINIPLSTFYLSLASYAEIYHFVYLIPVSLLAGNMLGSRQQAAKLCCSYFLLW
eukprot:CAMPEP_0113526716 /NCGR_PEP_ID=MMETSP0015_2-20120614/899_1 /TAXON_ID=2838 /ORGANISM="Odontella" /LENGTH=302 /DNA_ID=CAMNT_0000425079 /DNA_START=209 /DNA_END=1114 /DNA_ORIENTATION=+ /assembly_acc=CAM_ASM_000160